MATPDLAEVVEQITTYVQAHPAAGDTLAGVMGWWVPSNPLELVKAALDILVSRGVLGVRMLPSGEPFYFRVFIERPEDLAP